MGDTREPPRTEGTKERRIPRRKQIYQQTHPRYQTRRLPSLRPDTRAAARPVVLQLTRTRPNPLRVIVSPSPERRCRRSSLSPARMQFPTVQNELAPFSRLVLRVEAPRNQKPRDQTRNVIDQHRMNSPSVSSIDISSCLALPPIGQRGHPGALTTRQGRRNRKRERGPRRKPIPESSQ